MRRLLAFALVWSCADTPTVGGSSSTGNALTARILRPDGTPAALDSVYLRPDRMDSTGSRLGQCDRNGRVAFGSIQPGSWVMEARGQSAGRLVRFQLGPHEERSLELKTGRYGKLSGQITLPAGVRSARIVLEGTRQTIETDSSGRFTVEDVSPGQQIVAATPLADSALGVARWLQTVSDDGSQLTLPTQSPSLTRPSVWSLAWSEDFATLSPSNWNFDTGNGCPDNCGWGNNNLQRYTPQSAFTRDGDLVLRAERVASGWTSGSIQTRGLFEFQYGRLEIRARMPAVRGAWSIMSLQGDSTPGPKWPDGGAIDIASLWGHRPDSLMGISHRADDQGHAQHLQAYTVSPQGWGDRWVTYAIEWSPTEILWLADDRIFHRVDGGPPFDHPFYLALTLAIGGTGNAVPDSLQAPFELTIDNVRLYRRTP